MPIDVNNLTFLYNEGTTLEKTAINNISVKINDNEFIGIIGHTGSGKSTFVQTLNSLLKPSSGTIFIDNIDINADKKTLKELRKKVGLVFQYPEHQLFEATVFKDVAFGPKNIGMNQEEILLSVTKALNIVGLTADYFEKSPFDLSGGQKRKVAIAGVLAMNPKILILDEPTAGLDPKSRDEILNCIKKMHEELKITVLLVSHSMEDVAKLATRIIVFNKGEIFLDGLPSEIFTKTEELESIGLSSPAISILMNKLCEKGFNIKKDIYTISDATKHIFEMLKKD